MNRKEARMKVYSLISFKTHSKINELLLKRKDKGEKITMGMVIDDAVELLYDKEFQDESEDCDACGKCNNCCKMGE
jgi:hypothetical protein